MTSLHDYAQAYVQSAAKDHDVVRDFDAIADQIRGITPLRSFLTDSSVAAHVKQNAIAVAFPFASDTAVNFFTLLAQEGVIEKLEALQAAVRHAAAEQEKARYACVQSAVPLTDADTEHITRLLKKRFDAEISLEQKINHSLIAGFSVSVGDWTLDASLKGKMDRLQQTLLSPRLQEAGA